MGCRRHKWAHSIREPSDQVPPAPKSEAHLWFLSPSSGGILFNKWKLKCLHALKNNDAALLRQGLQLEAGEDTRCQRLPDASGLSQGADPNAFLEEEEDCLLGDNDSNQCARAVGFFPKFAPGCFELFTVQQVRFGRRCGADNAPLRCVARLQRSVPGEGQRL